MEIGNLSGFLAVQSSSPLQRANRANSVNSEPRANEVSNQVATYTQLSANQQDLLKELSTRIAENSNLNVEISLNINVIKANLGSLLSDSLGQSDSNVFSDIVSDLLSTNGTSLSDQEISTNLRERFIEATIEAGFDDSALFGDSDSSSGVSISDFISGGPDSGTQLLLDFLTGEMGTNREDAEAIIDILLNQSFQVVA